jgi:PHO85 cyclin-6/7
VEAVGQDEKTAASTTGGASRFPSPPSSSSPGASSPMPSQQQPSPASDSLSLPPPADAYHSMGTSSPRQSSGQTTIHVRDLAHIQSLARADMVTGNGPGILSDTPLQQMKYEISGMPIGDIIEMVAALLTKITTTNDLQHDAMQRNVAHQQQASQTSDAASSQMSPLSTSVLAFHGKNVPAITILSYLSRIHKYCPTTYEVFLSLLVYFDRMTERVNDMVVKNEEVKRLAALQAPPAAPPQPQEDTVMKDDANESDETDSDLADDDDVDDRPRARRDTGLSMEGGIVVTGVTAPTSASGPATYFVVDSFNIHRLIIAGVTCASKFFSDVFYTNSRYAKVCLGPCNSSGEANMHRSAACPSPSSTIWSCSSSS